MPQLSDQAQFRAQCILQGRHHLDAASHALMEVISQRWQVQALDFFCETKTHAGGKPQQLVHLILATSADAQGLQSNRDAQAEIASLVHPFLLSDAVQGGKLAILGAIFPASILNAAALVVTFRPLKMLDEATLKEMLDHEKRALLESYETVWTMSQSVIFFFTDAQLAEFRTNGITTQISNELLAIERKYFPESNTVFYFDSKETFDRDFSSNWYYYWK